VAECEVRLRNDAKEEKAAKGRTDDRTSKNKRQMTSSPNKLSRIEEEIRRAKLKDVLRMKEELEEKLESLNNNVELLQDGVEMPKSRKAQQSSVTSKQDWLQDKEAQEKKRQAAAEFIRSVKQREEERRQKEQGRRQQLLERMQKESEEKTRLMHEKEEEILQKRKADMAQAYQQLKQKRQEELQKQSNTDNNKPKEEEYLYKRYEERYNKEVIMPMLEEKKQLLAQKRSHVRSVTQKELADHRARYEQVKFGHEETRLQELRQRRAEEQDLIERQKSFKTDASLRVSELDQKAKDAKKQKLEEKRQLRSKMERYADLVKEVCPVRVSKEKSQEVQQHIVQLQPQVRQARDTRHEYSLTKLHKREKRNVQSTSTLRVPPEATNDSTNYNDTKSDTKPKSKSKPSRKSADPSAQRLPPKLQDALQKIVLAQAQACPPRRVATQKRLNYLAELRKRREDEGRTSVCRKYDWHSDLNNSEINPLEKVNRIVNKATLIEEEAEMHEKLLHAKGGPALNLELGERVTDLFVDAIKAKLSLLEHL
jgi:hypothetical protein